MKYLPLLPWFDRNQREMPWRKIVSPYRTWVSEIMLQQTGVSVVIPYFNRWMERFPTVEVLACANEQEVFNYWAGLGYYRRAKFLHEGAKQIALNGFPSDFRGWLEVKGVGRYTAAAISSIVYGEHQPLVDGNVKRVFSRLTGNSESEPLLEKEAWKWAEANLDSSRPGDWNQALMELGATVCTPTQPTCSSCPIKSECLALALNKVDTLPPKSHKTVWKKLEMKVDVLFCNEGDDLLIGLKLFQTGEWWNGLYGFPPHNPTIEIFNEVNLSPLYHTVTNHKVTLLSRVGSVQNFEPGIESIPFREIADVPLPAPFRKILERAKSEYFKSQNLKLDLSCQGHVSTH